MTNLDELYSNIIDTELENSGIDPDGPQVHYNNINNAAKIVVDLYKNNIAETEVENKKDISEKEIKVKEKELDLKKEISKNEIDFKEKALKSESKDKESEFQFKRDIHESEYAFKEKELEVKKEMSEADNAAKKDISSKELDFKKKELEFKEKELAFKQEQAKNDNDLKEKELKLKKDISKSEIELKEKIAEDEKKARNKDIWFKLLIGIVPIVITSVVSVIVVKISCKENRDTLMATLFANETMERIGELSNITSREVSKEALKLATQNVKLK